MTAALELPLGDQRLEADSADERYTTRETLDWCKRAAGVDGFDLDVAACAEAHCAPHYYTLEDDGLSHRWWGRVWCNPPFSDIEPWVRAAWGETSTDDGPELVAMLLPCNRTEQPWWQEWVEPFRDARDPGSNGVLLTTRFLPGRVAFGRPGNREAVGVGSPPFGCVLLVWRRP